MLGNRKRGFRAIVPQRINDAEQTARFAVCDRTHRPSQDRKQLAVTRGNARKESQHIKRKAFCILSFPHDDIWVKHPLVFLVRGQIYNIDLVCNLRQPLFPTAALGFRVKDKSLCAVQNSVVSKQVERQRFTAAQRAEKCTGQRIGDRAFNALCRFGRLNIDILVGIDIVAEIDTVTLTEHLRCAESQTGEKITGDILHIVIHVPLTCRNKFAVQSHHITDRPNQLDTCVIVEIAHLVTAAFEFFHVRRGNAHNIGQLVHGFFALVKNTFEFIYAVQRFCHLIGGFRVIFPRMIIEVFQLFFLVANRM